MHQKQQLQSTANGLRRAVGLIVAAGFQLDKAAFDYLKTLGSHAELTSIVQSIISEARRTQATGDTVIRQPLAEGIASKYLQEPTTEPEPAEPIGAPAPYAKQIDARVRIVRDPGSEIGSAATIEDFAQYFRDRYQKQRLILHERFDARAATTLAQALSAGLNEKVKFVAMVMEKRERGRRLFLEVDDLEDAATIMVDGGDNRPLLEAGQRLPLDQVACFDATRARGDLFVAQAILMPDVPDRRPKGSDEEVYAVLLSDLHVGSRMFLSEALQRVLDWLNLRIGNAQQRRIAEHAKYVIICGDIVDGIGVYPRQEEELEIADIYKQYEAAAKYVEQIPDYVELIVIPGNHDAARQAMPQPPIMKSVAESFYSVRAIHSLGNPAEIELHGVSFLLHHGRSLDDIIATVPGMNFANPARGMEFQLKCRHLVPEYGKRTAIAPERIDHLVIDRPPDVFQSGHIHVVQHSIYRGTQVVNSGAWQAQTAYQRRMGLTPTPGILPVMNLRSLEITMTNFRSPLA